MSNRIAFITGASRGIGQACALTLARAGHRVILAARNAAKLEEVATEAREAGVEAYVVEIDLSNPDSVQAAFHKAQKEFGNVEILVNNAAITRDGLAVRMKKEDWDAVINTNLYGSFQAIQQVLPGMMRARWGRIVNITSVVGLTGNPGQANYVASKAALIGLTKSLAQEMAPRNITVNAVAPGFIETEMTAGLPQELKDKLHQIIPLKRLGAPADVAAAVKFLTSDEAGYITGQTLSVNGGMYM
jgi:3-oxoacyl-[acyl-carrier protein] reductase